VVNSRLQHGLHGLPLARGEQRQHGETLIQRGVGLGDDGVDLGLQGGDFFGGLVVAFGEFGESLQQGRLPPEQLAGLLVRAGSAGRRCRRPSPSASAPAAKVRRVAAAGFIE
jgi:hypothetical protein